MSSFENGRRDTNEGDPADRRPDWVIVREQEELLQADEAEDQYEQERAGEGYGRRDWVAEAAADDDDDVDY